MSEIKKLFEATKPFRDEISKLHAKVERLKADNATLSLNSDGIWEKLKAAELQVGELKKVVGWMLNTHGVYSWTKAPKYGAKCSCTGCCEARKHLTNDTRKDPTDDERRAAKEAQDKKFRPPDWTRSGRHG